MLPNLEAPSTSHGLNLEINRVCGKTLSLGGPILWDDP